MKSSIVLGIAVWLFAVGIANGQGGSISLTGDPGGLDCNLPDFGPGVEQYYVFHDLTPGATAISFAAPLPPCHTGTWLSDTPVFAATVGNSQTGVTIGYGVCLGSPIHVLTINVQTFGTTPACCCYPVFPHPTSPSGQVEMVDCVATTLFATPLGHRVNANGFCGSCLYSCSASVPVEASTWGRIKAIYEE